jgi:hypothetical protein
LKTNRQQLSLFLVKKAHNRSCIISGHKDLVTIWREKNNKLCRNSKQLKNVIRN